MFSASMFSYSKQNKCAVGGNLGMSHGDAKDPKIAGESQGSSLGGQRAKIPKWSRRDSGNW